MLTIVATNHKEDSKLTKAKMKKAFSYKPDAVLLECNFRILISRKMRDQWTAFIEASKG
ncbi:hypothetical protein Mefer_1452 [Methanocaldococcus fervens AG86]|uniref:Uncharacterized protein n=1 Tax=Methanocaldococcus fervens (strain DSM 4213 / JCM 15782 / AG86) TaxID=573064 RepID=C7P9M4_METFA|nr:hypothetical protein Mefer_1452 [Methanocaldococcus fervens AG86]